MKILKAPNGFLLPFDRWQPEVNNTEERKIWWQYNGYYRYRVTGTKAWVEVEIPAPPKEPRFVWDDATRKKHARWLTDWQAYADEYGAPAAAAGTMCCDYSIVSDTFNKWCSRDVYPPDYLTKPIRQITGVDPTNHGMAMAFVAGGSYRLDFIGFLRELFRRQQQNFNEWENRDGSAKQWITDFYGEKVAAAVGQLMKWEPPADADEKYFDRWTTYKAQLFEAMATTRKLKR